MLVAARSAAPRTTPSTRPDPQAVPQIFAPDKTLVFLVGTPLNHHAERQGDPASVHLNNILGP